VRILDRDQAPFRCAPLHCTRYIEITLMSELVVISFDDVFKADRVLTGLLRLEEDRLIDMEDAVVAIRLPDGTVQLKQTISPPVVGAASGAAKGAVLGGLIGLFFLAPVAGIAIGAVAGAGIGAAAGSTLDYGIDDRFIADIARALKPDTSALFLLIEKPNSEELVERLSGLGGHVIRTSLSSQQEQLLREAVTRHDGRSLMGSPRAAAPGDG
jgi:uncharacterized membrane protein